MQQKSILIVEDSQSLTAIYRSYLLAENYEVTQASTRAEAAVLWRRLQPDFVLLDIKLPDGSGLSLLNERPEEAHPADVIVMTAHGSSNTANEAMQLGATDYLEKPFDADRLLTTLGNSADRRQLRHQVDQLAALQRSRFHGFVGSSPPMQTLYRIIESVARSQVPAFIKGESGTGKELAAEAIHLESGRQGLFHAINCAALAPELIESELFGHTKGAFTGAASDREGAVSYADGGTLFLDEICEMDLSLQKKLLRFLQTGEYRPIGSNRLETVDLRVICATNRDPMEEVRQGSFREDLFYRLHVVPVEMPALRDRGDDILRLAMHFLEAYSRQEGKSFKGFTLAAEKALKGWRWPGNVRELRNIIHQVVVLNDSATIEAGMLRFDEVRVDEPDVPDQPDPARRPTQPLEPLWQTEKRAIEAALDHCNGNVRDAAELLEVAPSTIYRKRQQWQTLNQTLKTEANRSCTDWSTAQ